MLILRPAWPMLIVVTSFRFRIDQVEPAWNGSQNVLLAGERLAVGYNAKVGDVITVPTASGIFCGSITGFPLIRFVNGSWVGVTVSGVDVADSLHGLIADIRPADPAGCEEQGRGQVDCR